MLRSLTERRKTMRPGLPPYSVNSRDAQRLPEVPRLRNRFRNQREILGDNFNAEVKTTRRMRKRLAKRLSLEDDWDPSWTSAELQAAAETKWLRQRDEFATIIQTFWRCRYLAQAHRRRIQAIEAAKRLQRWWRHRLYVRSVRGICR